MYDKEKIIPGVIIFVLIFLSPFVYNFALGKRGVMPELVYPKEKKCVESKEFMRSRHMELLDQWRNSVVRDGNGMYTASDGEKYDMSLQNTCLKCHNSRAQFCDSCHNYASVAPGCWDCHVTPKEND